MNTRKEFDNDLDHLKTMLLDMVEASKQAITEAIASLKDQNIERANQIIKNDGVLNKMESEINEKAILMIAKQAPVATDLRKIIVALKISSDVERIGDLAVNIAKSTIHIGAENLVKPIEEIPKMADVVQDMLSKSIDAFYNKDVALAKKVADTDDVVDEMYGKLISELMELMTRKPESIQQITQLAFICRYVERIGDHITNITENIIYQVTGKRYDLNQ
ncbi:phosphate signaling complex protein PhoU [Fredinandcohnia quinoae]|uniref:Phosphate-specific transport system accessory protein PhoU n=1 Tax=Fredinandcohnia quinoae TaxID=2918902 RepID=A0AAW5E4M4_9BACI|nr:phosphate signaling complex protein PhoU [Fredinandcohnia sp. SECRCQ15]MCH1624936.1 phosphate signaling complex protein PhoU [Fredinandcohnia sp. SECRCQ15]